MNSIPPLVSILVTVYNGETRLKAALDSLLNQSYPYTEIIVVDDGSTDNSPEILEGFAKHDERIKAFRPGRLGRAKALNYGLMHCHGEYIAINDADDFSLPHRIQKQVQFLEENEEYVLVGSKMYIHNSKNGEKIKHYSDHARPVEDAGIRKTFLKGQPIQHSSVMMKTEIAKKIGGYNENIKFLLDRDIFIRLSQLGKLHNLDEALISVGRSDQQYFRNTFTGRERILQDFKYRAEAAKVFKASTIQKLKIELLKYWTITVYFVRNLINKTI